LFIDIVNITHVLAALEVTIMI